MSAPKARKIGHEIAAFFAGTLDKPEAVLFVQEASSLIVFAELSTRHDIKELAGKKVGYVEGLYVVPTFWHRGVASKLLPAARLWAGQNRCEALTSDRAERIVVDPHF